MKKIENRQEKKERKPFLDTEFYKVCSSKFTLIYSLIFILNIITIIFQANLYTSLIVIIPLILIDIFYYIVFKNEISEFQQKVAYILFRINILCAFLVLTNYIIVTSVSIDKLAQILCVLGDVIISLLYLALSTQREFNDKITLVKDIDVRENLDSIKLSEDSIDPEDAILGYKINRKTGKVTKEPVILPATDRFLHMLILGPTGCGKTSQTILPSIWRDINNYQPVNGKPVGITVLEPKGDLAEKVYAMVNYKNKIIDEAIQEGTYDKKKHGLRREVLYFNPILANCPYFNPLVGDEDDVIENMCTTFNMLNADSPQYFKDMTDGLVRRSVKLLKRLHGNEATLLDLNTLVWNVGDEGRKKYVMKLRKMSKMPDGTPIRPDIKRENDELIDWFLNDYYAGIGGAKGAPKTYENTSGVRTQISKLVSNKYLKKVLNPPRRPNEVDGNLGDAQAMAEYQESLKCERINFDTALAEGQVVTMSTCQGTLRDLGRFLGYFIILQLQASVFRRPGNEDTRTHNMLYIDEFQVYSNPGFSDMLTQGRSYRVASHLATQARAQIGMGSGKDGKSFIELVSTNARNKIIYPGVSFTDAKFYSDEFGQEKVIKEDRRYTQKAYFNMPSDTKVAIGEQEKDELRFTPTDIMDRKFGEITYRIVSHNSVQPPGVSKISYIPKEINDILNKMIAEDNAARLNQSSKVDYEESINVDANKFNEDDSIMKIEDPLSGVEAFDYGLDENDTVDTKTKPKTDLFGDAISVYQQPEKTGLEYDREIPEYFDNGSSIPERPSAHKPEKKQEKHVEFIDDDM